VASDKRLAALSVGHREGTAEGHLATSDPLSPHMLGQRQAGLGQQSPPTYNTRAEANDYADGWYEISARPAPTTLHPRWRWIRLLRWWRIRPSLSRRDRAAA
jgi:hypothetical protein